MKLSTRLSLYAACISLAIGLGITFTLEYSAARNERKDAERLTELMQKQLVRNIGADLRNVERQVERTALEMALSRAVFTERNAGIVLRIMLESDSLIQGCCVAFLPNTLPDHVGGDSEKQCSQHFRGQGMDDVCRPQPRRNNPRTLSPFS